MSAFAPLLGCKRTSISPAEVHGLTKASRCNPHATTCRCAAANAFAVMLTTTMVVKGYSDGVYSLESAAIEGR
jgi:hypothetical protein